MIYVRVEIWPLGDHEVADLVREIVVANVGGNHERGQYEVRVSRREGFRGQSPATPRHRRIKNPIEESVLARFSLKHRRSEGIWVLLWKVLGQIRLKV